MEIILFLIVKFISWSRKAFLREIQFSIPNFELNDINDKWEILMSDEHIISTSKYLYELFDIRQRIAYQYD